MRRYTMFFFAGSTPATDWTEDPNGEWVSYNEASTKINHLLKQNEDLRNQLCQQIEAAQDMAHIIIECGIGHLDLDRCGCESCEAVRTGMIEAGYLRKKDEID